MAKLGQVLEGKYEILKLIGKGGMSKVYLAIDKNLNKPWAIKEIVKNPNDKNNEIVISSALAEANMMKKLDHPILPRIVDIIDRAEAIYVVMDYIEGEPLNKILEKEGAQDQINVINWAIDLCEALDYLHSQTPPIIYRDMKPANIMLQPNGNIKLIDFGIAREYKEYNLEDTVSLGTKGYAAPEQFGGKGQTDRRTDVYSLGVTLYHLVTGKNPTEPPYEIYPIRYWNEALSGGLEKIIQKCTQLNPEDRYDNCAELIYDLTHYEEVDDKFKSVQKKKLAGFITVLALSVVSLGVGVFGQVMMSQNRSELQEQHEKVTDVEKTAEAYAIIFHGEKLATKEKHYEYLEDFIYEDGEINNEEIDGLNNNIYSRRDELKNTDFFGDLAFKIGEKIWFNYIIEGKKYPEQSRKKAVSWFKEAVECKDLDEDRKKLASSYIEVVGIKEKVSENKDTADSYKNLYEGIKRIYENSNKLKDENSGVPEMKADTYMLCYEIIKDYYIEIADSGIDNNDILKFYDDIYENVKAGIDSSYSGRDTKRNLNDTMNSMDVTRESIRQKLSKK